MRASTVVRGSAITLTAVSMSLPSFLMAAASNYADTPFLQNGRVGFVVTNIRYALAEDAEKTGACPDGMSLNVEEIFTQTPEGKRRRGETDKAYADRLNAGSNAMSNSPDGQNFCEHPEISKPDPFFKSLRAINAVADGIDLDKRGSSSTSAPNTCAHDELVNPDGTRGVDNQFARVVGCSRSYQSSRASNGFGQEMLTGSWGILVTLDGVDDLRNDDEVQVGLYANADPIQLSPSREPLDYATYAIDQDPRFRATARGRIKDGVLITEPTDLRLRHVTNSLRLERVLRDARVQATISGDGAIEGYLAGYAPVEALYDYQFGFRTAKDGTGKLASDRLRLGTSNGAARVLGYTCPGIYHALHQYADGHPDPQTGQCTSISTQYRFKAIPAFVVDVATQSTNTQLDKKANSNARP